MQARTIDPADYASQIDKALPKGILLTTSAQGTTDTMVIGWGQLGRLWNSPTFTAFVRTSRETRRLLDLNPQFTVNVPLSGKLAKDVVSLAGTKSGRDHDKFAELGLTAVPGRKVDVPAIAEVPLTLECQVRYRGKLDKDAMPLSVQQRFYPVEKTDPNLAGNAYTHFVYFAEIVDAYILED